MNWYKVEIQRVDALKKELYWYELGVVHGVKEVSKLRKKHRKYITRRINLGENYFDVPETIHRGDK